MRFVLLIRLLFPFALAVAAWSQPPGQQINPHTQIRWPRNCTGPGHVYNLEDNTCIDMDAIDPGYQLLWPTGCTVSNSMVYAPGNNACFDINAIDPTAQVVWPPSCGPNMVYVPATKTCSASIQGPPGPPGGSLSYPGVVSDGNNGLTATGMEASVNKTLNVMAAPYNAAGNPEYLTCTATASSVTLTCGSAGSFSPGQGIYISHAGAMPVIAAPSAPTVTPMTFLATETGIVPASSPYTITVAHAATFIQFAGLAYHNETLEHNGVMLSVGALTPGKAEYSVSSAGVITFSSVDAGRNVWYAYAYGDPSGTTTHTYSIAAIDALGGESAASATTTITTSQATLGWRTYRNRLCWPSLLVAGYAIYRDGVLHHKTDELPVWQPRQLYHIGDIILPKTANSHEYIAIQDGASGNTEPAWPTTTAGTITESPDYDSPVGVQWQENGAPLTCDDDADNANDYFVGYDNSTILELNMAHTPPSATLADAFVGTVASVSGTTITLASQATTSASGAFTVHDDSAAFQAVVNASTASTQIQVPEGYYRISSPIVMPSNVVSMFGFSGQGVNNIYTGYTSRQWQAVAPIVTPGGGSVLSASRAMPRLFDYTSATSNASGSSFSQFALIGYGAGQQSGFGNELATGLPATTLSHMRFAQIRTYNWRRGWNLSLQWSTWYEPQMFGDWIGITFPASGAGKNYNNQLDVYAPSSYLTHIAYLIRGGGMRVTDGTYELNDYDAVIGGGLIVRSLQTEHNSADALKGGSVIDAFACSTCIFNNIGAVGDGVISTSIGTHPGILLRSSTKASLTNVANSNTGVRLGISGASGWASSSTVITTTSNTGSSSTATTMFIASTATGTLLQDLDTAWTQPIVSSPSGQCLLIDPTFSFSIPNCTSALSSPTSSQLVIQKNQNSEFDGLLISNPYTGQQSATMQLQSNASGTPLTSTFLQLGQATGINLAASTAGNGLKINNSSSTQLFYLDAGNGKVSTQNQVIDDGSAGHNTTLAGNITLNGTGTSTMAGILNVNGTGSSSFGGALIGKGGFSAQNASPNYSVEATGQGTDQKWWDYIVQGTTMHFRALNDAVNSSNDWMTVNRGSGYTLTNLAFGEPTVAKAYTVATLPTCAAGTKGFDATVTDATSPTYLGLLTGGGTVFTPVVCNGTAWVSY